MAFHPINDFRLPLSTPPTVWIVDDDEDDQLFIRSAFKETHKPIRVHALTDGDQLLPQLTDCEELPSLILLDINMNRQDGFETLNQIRNTPGFAHLPVVMLTTSTDASDCRRSLALGANQCLTKPTSYRQLVSLVKELTSDWELA
ncbi:response regulator [Spirosoma sp. KCTC 42546]|uniref:response regulator n=1 Tax=Spirosoma sp. KCTC 42546 TaxID=2520506 RepID=UPI001158CECD|nr:response regulator [Spirosoma sp. KCTC 42546]QDK78025.1 response regulator [Spirosoma sp. KCTC 42546]